MNIPFLRLTPERVRAKLLEEARLFAEQHEAAAEHHAALAVMFRKRIERIEPAHVVATDCTPLAQMPDLITPFTSNQKATK